MKGQPSKRQVKNRSCKKSQCKKKAKTLKSSQRKSCGCGKKKCGCGNKTIKRGGNKNCGCDNKSVTDILKMNGGGCGCRNKLVKHMNGGNLADTKYYYGVNSQEDYNLPESSSMQGGKRKTRKMKGGNLLGRTYDNFFLNVPESKGMLQAGNIVDGKTMVSSAPYDHPAIEASAKQMLL
jgi:hypothetical protein|uniref:Uncharacterized protein n=1 Tax=viral metagenome TaxID=1070528 RepID=A0A6C0IME3_9ZZZZ